MHKRDSRKPKRVLSVDDDPNMHLILSRVFMGLPVTLRGVQDAAESVPVALSWRPDLVLLDLMLPGMSGWDILGNLRAQEQLADTPVVVITAKISPYDRLLGANVADVAAYVAKPFQTDELRTRVEEILWPK